MKISEFAAMNKVTAKMLRHYDEMGLLKPAAIDPETGYRSYESEQAYLLSWIVILKSLAFSLTEIKALLDKPVESHDIIRKLINKRIEIATSLNEQIHKKIVIDRLIKTIEKEGFHMDREIRLMDISYSEVHEIKKNMPNMEMFLETARHFSSLCTSGETLAILRFDISHFKSVNDDYGYEVGDSVIVACYSIISANISSHLENAAIARAHGDEFVVVAKAGLEAVQQAAEAIVRDMQAFDFTSIGCLRQMACYIGGLVVPPNEDKLRHVIADTVEILNQARDRGPNMIVIKEHRL